MTAKRLTGEAKHGVICYLDLGTDHHFYLEHFYFTFDSCQAALFGQFGDYSEEHLTNEQLGSTRDNFPVLLFHYKTIFLGGFLSTSPH